jgi:fructose-specific phosphotransferase system IIC component
MKSAIVLLLIIGFMFLGYFLNSWLQKIIKPKRSLGRLFIYFLAVLIAVFVVSFFMVFVIGKLYPAELIK